MPIGGACRWRRSRGPSRGAWIVYGHSAASNTALPYMIQYSNNQSSRATSVLSNTADAQSNQGTEPRQPDERKCKTGWRSTFNGEKEGPATLCGKNIRHMAALQFAGPTVLSTWHVDAYLGNNPAKEAKKKKEKEKRKNGSARIE